MRVYKTKQKITCLIMYEICVIMCVNIACLIMHVYFQSYDIFNKSCKFFK